MPSRRVFNTRWVPFNLHLSKDVHSAIKREAFKRGMTFSAVVRECLSDHVDASRGAGPRAHGKKPHKKAL